LLPMSVAASEALGKPATLNVVADTGYSNGEHASRCEEIGIITHVPAKRSVNPHGLFDRSTFNYQTASDTFLCPEGKTLTRKQLNRPIRSITERHSLFPASFTRYTDSAPCGNTCPDGRDNGLTLFHSNDTNDLAPASTQAAFVSMCSIPTGGAAGCVPFG
jgi:hypothetical protein